MQGPYLEALFPNLAASGYSLTSRQTDEYNCIAWAAGDTERWWWPTPDPDLSFWPVGVPRERTLDRFVQAYEILGYQVCENPDLEEGVEKVAIYTNDKSLPTHAARQLPSGRWTSKLGSLEDIEHLTLESVNGNDYGSVSTILKRPLAEASPNTSEASRNNEAAA